MTYKPKDYGVYLHNGLLDGRRFELPGVEVGNYLRVPFILKYEEKM